MSFRSVRRVVTGTDESGKSTIVDDAQLELNVPPDSPDGFGMLAVWLTTKTPANLEEGDETALVTQLAPPKNGTVLYIVDLPPSGIDASGEPALAPPGLHQTPTVDYGVVLSGELVAVLDDAEVTLTPGDVLIQRGTHHGWSNRSNESCRILFVLLDAVG